MRFNNRLLATGAVAILITIGFFGFVVRSLSGDQRGTYLVTASFDRAGQLLKEGGDVKLRGILVGRISDIERASSGTITLSLAMDGSQEVPKDITASIRGKTLFGEKYVALLDDRASSSEHLADGDVIPQDRTVEPFELEQVLQTALPLLEVVGPGDLGGALRALAEGFAGQEDEGRRAIDNGLVALQSLNAQNESLSRLLSGLDESSGALAAAAPSLIRALRDLNELNQTVIANKGDISGSLKDTPRWLGSLASLMRARYSDLLDIAIQGNDVLDVVTAKRSVIPTTVEGLKNFTQAWVTDLSVGCRKASGQTVDQAHPNQSDGTGLERTTCWQIWQVDNRSDPQENKVAYANADRPVPNPSTAQAAYLAQLRTLLALPFGRSVPELSPLLFDAIKDANGLVPEELL